MRLIQTPANAVVATEERRNRKRKKPDAASSGVIPGLQDNAKAKAGESNGKAKAAAGSAASGSGSGSGSKPGDKEKDNQPPAAPKKTAVYVTGLPPTTTVEELENVFSKAGVLMIGDDGGPRIKLYYDDDGKFKGEALVMYFKEGSVDLAITLLDDTELQLGAGVGNMHVKVAEYDKSAKKTNEEKKKKDAGLDKDGLPEKKKLTAEEKLRITKRIKRLQEWVSFRWSRLRKATFC
jgi:HIV Tat-specific factor 1